jgi:hypothetical protein
MSEASIPFHPAIDEPSNACPSLNLSSPKAFHRHRHVLLLPLGVGKAQVDKLDLVFLDCFEDVGNCH